MASGDALYRPTWVEINLDHIQENTSRLVALAARKGLRLMGVVKADAYGHGAVESARAVLRGGASSLAVALPEEGIRLREAGIDAPILVMGAYIPKTVAAYADYDLAVTVSDLHQAGRLAEEAPAGRKRVKVHLKVDTGMGRLGVLPPEALDLAQAVAKSGRLVVEGVFSHLATADEKDPSYTTHQMNAFEDVLQTLAQAGIRPPVRHILNSGGLLQHDPRSSNAARVGIALYGLHPSRHVRVIPLTPAMSWKTRVASVKRVPAGTDVSYGRTYRTAKETTLATLPVGYADGFTRLLSHRVHVLIAGGRYPVVGSICMDQTVVDVGDDSQIHPGDEVVLLGVQGSEQILPDDWADTLGTINYEVVCMVSGRVPRLYVGQGADVAL